MPHFSHIKINRQPRFGSPPNTIISIYNTSGHEFDLASSEYPVDAISILCNRFRKIKWIADLVVTHISAIKENHYINYQDVWCVIHKYEHNGATFEKRYNVEDEHTADILVAKLNEKPS